MSAKSIRIYANPDSKHKVLRLNVLAKLAEDFFIKSGFSSRVATIYAYPDPGFWNTCGSGSGSMTDFFYCFFMISKRKVKDFFLCISIADTDPAITLRPSLVLSNDLCICLVVVIYTVHYANWNII